MRGAASFIRCPYLRDPLSHHWVNNSLQIDIGVAAKNVRPIFDIFKWMEKSVLLTLGISHKTAPIAIREKLAFSPERISNGLEALKATTQIQEIALLSTCNRTEIYCQAPSPRWQMNY